MLLTKALDGCLTGEKVARLENEKLKDGECKADGEEKDKCIDNVNHYLAVFVGKEILLGDEAEVREVLCRGATSTDHLMSLMMPQNDLINVE